MRVALLGGGTIARLVLQHVRGGEFPGMEIVALAGRNGSSRGRALAREFGVSYVSSRAALVAARPAAVVEAASHDAVREHLVALLEAGIGVVVLSIGALADDRLRYAAEDAARRSGALLYVPSGGIGGLDALKAACAAGVDEVSIQVAKPPVAAEEPLHAELKSFLAAVRNRSTPLVPIEDGRRALALALEIVSAIQAHGEKVDLASIAKVRD